MIGLAIAIGGLVLVTLVVLHFLAVQNPASDSGSPVEWISDQIWEDLRLGDRRPGGGRGSWVMNPRLIEVSAEDRQRIPAPTMRSHLPSSSRPGPPSPELLSSIPGPVRLLSPIWPICCSGLATLIAHPTSKVRLAGIEDQVGALDRAYLSEETKDWKSSESRPGEAVTVWSEILDQVRRGLHSGEGINVFECSQCGRRFVASCGPNAGSS